MKPKELSLNDIKIGDAVSFSRIFTEKDVNDFAKLSGDENPLHMDEKYAETTKFKHRLVHGMLVGSLCSTLVGMYMPGKRCLYLNQTLSFKNPVFINDKLTIVGEVKSKSISTGILEIFISIKKGETEVLNGTANVQVI
jgi:3-hydroxybutyryl-CoA dehydratase